ncbi:MAG: hypothetical protein PHU34_00810 [Candidatus Methanoperedens sp.]|nr:hypothetical protein [Candidatus Methanoperedens sp.]
MLNKIEYSILNIILKTQKARPSEIKEVCGLTEPTLYKYLNKLHDDEKYLLKKSYPNNPSHNIYYYINNNIEIFKKLVTEFMESSYWLEFYSSDYCQDIINAEFVKYIKSKWNYPDDESIRQSYREVLDYHQQKGECLEITEEKCLEMANNHIRGLKQNLFGDNVPFPYFSDDELLFILKSSHSAFKFAMTDVISPVTDAELLRMKEDILLFTWHPFCWEDVPGKDSIWLINFLEAVGVDWVKTAKIEKSSDNKVITISNEEKNLTFKLKDGKNKVKINEKYYVFYSKEVKKGCTMASFLHTDPDALDNNSLKETFSQLSDMRKKRYLSPIKQLIPNQLFLEQILLNFISDVRFGCFVAQPLYFTELKVELKVQMNLNGQKMISKDISYEASNSY